MNRIFLTLASFSNLLLLVTFALGWSIGDTATTSQTGAERLGWHFLVALGTSIVVLLVHAVALTYFMGTGRWIEETAAAYSLPPASREQNLRLKYQVLPGMIGCILLVLACGGLGAVADPASPIAFTNDRLWHFSAACLTLAANLVVSWIEYDAIRRNGRVVDEVVQEVNTRRAAHAARMGTPFAS